MPLARQLHLIQALSSNSAGICLIQMQADDLTGSIAAFQHFKSFRKTDRNGIYNTVTYRYLQIILLFILQKKKEKILQGIEFYLRKPGRIRVTDPIPYFSRSCQIIIYYHLRFTWSGTQRFFLNWVVLKLAKQPLNLAFEMLKCWIMTCDSMKCFCRLIELKVFSVTYGSLEKRQKVMAKVALE